MSTRATIHFLNDGSEAPEAIIYRHNDGYPEGLGSDLLQFCNELQANLNDTRFGDPAYLAARWIVWDAANHQATVRSDKDPHRCDFLGVGVVKKDPCDIEYRYRVFCRDVFGKGVKPRIVCQKVRCSYPDSVWTVEAEKVIQREQISTKKRSGVGRFVSAAASQEDL